MSRVWAKFLDVLERWRERLLEEADRWRQNAILNQCHDELNRTLGADLGWRTSDDARRREALLRKAAEAGLAAHETVTRLDFLQRLIAVLDDGHPPADLQQSLLIEASRLGLQGYCGVRQLQEFRELELLAEHGPAVVDYDEQGRPVYFRGEAEFRSRPGSLVLRDDGVTFTGEVLVDIAWRDVTHTARTTHPYHGYEQAALALQEGRRRIATKFTITSDERAAYACEAARFLWQRSKERPDPRTVSSASRGTTRRAELPDLRLSPSRAELPDLDLSTSVAECDFEIVGETNYQPELRRVAESGRTFTAVLSAEPTNPHDPDAVRVCAKGGNTVGYLSRDYAIEYRRVFALLAQHGHAGRCRARLIGGADEKRPFGVLLNLKDPESLLIDVRDKLVPEAAVSDIMRAF